MAAEEVKVEKKSGLGIAGLVLGVVALLTSFLPIINNASFVIAIIGFVLAVVGTLQCVRGKRAGKGLAIAGIVANVVACALVLGSQQMYSDAIDDAMSGPQVSDVQSAGDGDKDGSVQKDDPATTDLAVGTKVSLDNGLSVVVDSVATDIVDYDGDQLLGVHVTYTNDGDEGASYNVFDWKGETSSGAQEDPEFYTDGEEPLESGTLATGGSVSGTIFLKGDSVKALYMGSALDSTPKASWKIK